MGNVPRRSFPSILAGALAACGGGGMNEAPQTPPAPALPLKSLEINADSLFAEGKVPVGMARRIIELLPDWTIVDKSVVGLSLRSLVEGYTAPFKGAPTPPFGPQPRFSEVTHTTLHVLLNLGANDAYEGMPRSVYYGLLYRAVAELQGKGHKPILAGFGPFTVGVFDQPTCDLAAELNEATLSVAQATSCLHLHLGEPQSPEETQTIDGLHPTQLASDLKAGRVAAFMRTLV